MFTIIICDALIICLAIVVAAAAMGILHTIMCNKIINSDAENRGFIC